MKPITERSARALVVIVATAGLTLLVASSAIADATAEQRGATLLQSVDSGDLNCSDLTAADYEAIGEFTMGRMLGSPQAHESMDQLATRMMGTGGLERMHQVMGQRFADCGHPAFPGGFAQMMAMMPGMGGIIGSHGGGPMAGGQVYGPGGQDGGPNTFVPGAMMGSNTGYGRNSGDDGPTGWMVAAMVILLLGAAVLAYFLVRRRPQSQPALQALAGRFAAGEISAEEYESRRRLLEGGQE